MLKLILQHTFKAAGEAVDISRNENHGFRTAATFLADGMSPGSGALAFAGGPSRVRVPYKPVWANLRALKIEMWVKLDALGQRRNLIEGSLSFAFFIHPDGVLWGTFLGPETPGGSPTWHGANSQANSPDGTVHTVPLNQWVKLTYLHDGLASLRLYIDDKLVAANYNLVAGVPSVSADGVHIGHWPGDDRYTFSGQIDEVKIWKYDPEVPYKQLFCRPMDDRQMECWRQLFDQMAELLRDPETGKRFIGVMRCLWRATEEFVRAIRSKGEDAIARNAEFNARYRELWCAGKINGSAMEKLLGEWRDWLVHLLGEDYIERFKQRIQGCWHEFGGNQGAFGPFGKQIADCDPEFAGYLKLFDAIFGEKPDKPEPPKGLIDQIVSILRVLWEVIQKLLRRQG